MTSFHSLHRLPPVTFNFIIINILLYLVKLLFQYKYDIDISEYLGLRYYKSQEFHWYQLITYMFIHGNEVHLIFNMLSLWIFAPLLEMIWGTKRFMMYYFICGLGAAFTQYLFYYYSIAPYLDEFQDMHHKIMEIPYQDVRQELLVQFNEKLDELYSRMIIIGASGALYGLLAAYAVLFPNGVFYVYFVIPIKSKWFVLIFGLIELFTGVFIEDNIAHFAHLGGMIIGLIIVWIWKRKNPYHPLTE